MNRYWLVAAVPVLALSGCGVLQSPTQSTVAPEQPGVQQPGAPGSSTSQQDQSTSGTTESGAAPQTTTAVSNRDIVRTAQLWIVVDDLTADSTTVNDLATKSGGYVASVSTGSVGVPCDPACPAGSTESSADSATSGPVSPSAADQTLRSTEPTSGLVAFTLKVPAAKYDSVMAQLQTLGEVTSLSVNADDVTAQTQDLAARIASQQESVRRVRALMNRASTLSEVVAIERELAQRQADLEAMQAQQKRLADSVAMATISANLVDASRADVITLPQRHWWDDAWAAFTSTWRGILIVFAVLTPLLVLVGIGWWIVLRVRRHRSPAAGPDQGSDEPDHREPASV